MQIIAPPSIAAFCGSDQVVMQEALERALLEWHGGGEPNKQVLHLDDKASAAESNGDELILACYSQSLFVERRSIVVYGMEWFPESRVAELTKWLDSPTPETALLMFFGKWNSRSTLEKELTKRKLVQKFDAPSPFQLPQWLKENGGQYGFSIPLSVGHQIVDILGTDVERIRLELRKLQLYFADEMKGKKSFPLTAPIVEELLVEQNEGMAYKMHEAFFTRNPKAVNIFRQMMERGAERLVILSGFYNSVAHLLAATLLKQRGASIDEQASAMGVPPARFGYRRKWIGLHAVEELEQILIRLEEIEAQLKNGELQENNDFSLALLPILIYGTSARRNSR